MNDYQFYDDRLAPRQNATLIPDCIKHIFSNTTGFKLKLILKGNICRVLSYRSKTSFSLKLIVNIVCNRALLIVKNS